MASIHKRPGTPYLYAAWRGEGGRLFLRSTKQSDRSKAQAVALGFERAAKLAMGGNLTEQQARRVLSDILESTGASLRCPTTADFLQSWLDVRDATAAAGTLAKYRRCVAEFVRHLGPHAAKPLDSLTAHHVETFLAARIREGCSPSTAACDGRILRCALTRARRRGFIASNVAEAVDLPAGRGVTRGTFSPQEVKLLIAAAESPEWALLVAAAYFTGQRLSDVSNMAWADIDLAAQTWTLKQGKTKTEVVIPLHPDLLARLESLATSDKPEIHVMPGLAALVPGGMGGLSNGFKRLARRAGVDVQTAKGRGARMVSKRSFHALRHSFSSALMNAGVAPEVRMLLTGHKSKEVHRGYSHAELETLRGAVGKLESLK